MAEIGYLPNAEMLSKSNVPFAYFMIWSKGFVIGEQYNTVENFRSLYNDPYVITL